MPMGIKARLDKRSKWRGRMDIMMNGVGADCSLFIKSCRSKSNDLVTSSEVLASADCSNVDFYVCYLFTLWVSRCGFLRELYPRTGSSDSASPLAGFLEVA